MTLHRPTAHQQFCLMKSRGNLEATSAGGISLSVFAFIIRGWMIGCVFACHVRKGKWTNIVLPEKGALTHNPTWQAIGHVRSPASGFRAAKIITRP
ncbi:MAG: hypothetical protein OD918_09655, partial [Gammaproteobacteria bacterium]